MKFALCTNGKPLAYANSKLKLENFAHNNYISDFTIILTSELSKAKITKPKKQKKPKKEPKKNLKDELDEINDSLFKNNEEE